MLTHHVETDLERLTLDFRDGFGVKEFCFFSFFSFRIIFRFEKSGSPSVRFGPPIISSWLSPRKYHPLELKWKLFSTDPQVCASRIRLSLYVSPVSEPKIILIVTCQNKIIIYLNEPYCNWFSSSCTSTLIVKWTAPVSCDQTSFGHNCFEYNGLKWHNWTRIVKLVFYKLNFQALWIFLYSLIYFGIYFVPYWLY